MGIFPLVGRGDRKRRCPNARTPILASNTLLKSQAHPDAIAVLIISQFDYWITHSMCARFLLHAKCRNYLAFNVSFFKFAIISIAFKSILEKANHFLPKSFRLAPKW